jgi:hypothetical protein
MTDRRDLDFVLHAASVDTVDLDATRRVLLDRLSRHSNDLTATTALRALNTYTAEQHAEAQSHARAVVRTAGLSGLDRLRPSRAGGTT